eukprot:gene12030-16103_t
MGNNSSSKSNLKGARKVQEKIDTAIKTGVLNLADMDLKASSSAWPKLADVEVSSTLKLLDISNNTLKILPIEVYGMRNLKTLNASGCSLQRTHDLTGLSKLITLKLDRNDLEVDVLAQLPLSLQTINLSTNHFTAIPPALHTLIRIMQLDLSNNRIETLVGISTLINLTDLNLDDNNIVELPLEISNLIKIRHLSLKNNRIGKNALSYEGQSIPALFLKQSQVDNIELKGNIIIKSEILEFEGMDEFLTRRKENKDKNMAGGALIDHSLFGLD